MTVIASEQCHACCETAAAWLGIGAVHVIRAPSAADGSVQIAAIERAAREALASGRPVAAIVATLGSTDSFALDDLAAIAALAERLAHEFQLPSPPHVHADAVIGWPWSTFNDYDFQANPLQFAAATLAALTTARERIERLKLADSIGVDFHKTGFTPYISSLFLVRDRVDFTRLALPSDHAPYLYRSGEQHPGLFTLETSRSAIGALGAMANLSALDKQGYRVLIGHAVELTQRLRTRLGAEPRVAVLNERNVGFMTLFRVYPRGVDAHAALDRELCDPSYNERLAAHNQFNQQLFADSHAAAANGDGIALALTNIDRRGASGEPILALRAGTLSPFMGEHHLKAIVAQLLVD